MTITDRAAALLAMHGLELARHLRRLVRDDAAAEDLLQETLLRAHRALTRLGPGVRNERAWLYRIATNVALNHLRAVARERRALESAAREQDAAVAPGETTGDTERREALWLRVAALPARQRVALTLRVADELDYEEIAERMGGTIEAARANVYQAKKTLRMEVQ
jgi:RNA polymerase sigma-70 factor (ECF subfamily)